MTDAELCKASSEGREEAFVELVRRYQGAVCAVTYAISGEHALSEDLAQDTFLVAWKKLPGIAAPDRVGPWLTGIARNLSRRSGRRARPEALAETSGAHPVEPDADPEEAIVEQQDRARVWRLLGTLPERIREAMVLYYREEQSASRVAELLGISVAATEQRLSRGRKQLRAKVERELDRELADALGRTRPSEDFTRKVAAVLPLGVPTTLSADQLAEVVARPSPVAPTGAGWLGVLTKGIAMKKLVAAVVAVLAIVVLATQVSGRGKPEADAAASGPERDPPTTVAGDPHETEDAPSVGRVGGSVVGADGAVLAGSVVTVTSPDGQPVVLRRDGEAIGLAIAKTGDDGRFSIAGLAPGRYVATASLLGHRPARTEPFALGLDRSREDLQLTLVPGGHAVTGQVADVEGGPIEGAVIRARLAGRTVAAITDAEGRYALTLDEGKWHLTAWDIDYEVGEGEVWIHEADRVADFVLVPGGSIFGTVVDRSTGEPVSDARVTFDLKRRSGRGYSSRGARAEEIAVSDAHGRFALRRLGAAQYQLWATADHRASRAPVDLPLAIAEHVEDVVVYVDEAYNAQGRVVLEQADPTAETTGVEGVEITVLGDGYTVETTSAADGRFVLQGLFEGAYSVHADGPDVISSPLEAKFTVGNADVDDLRVPVERGTTVKGVVRPAAAADLELMTVQRVGGFEVYDAALRARKARARSDADGSFTLSLVPPGAWRLIAKGVDGSYGEAVIEVPPTGLADAAVDLTPRASVRGTLVDASGTPVVAARVHLDLEGQRGPPRGEPLAADTDDDGAFEIVGVADGAYRVVASDRNHSRLLPVDPAQDHRGLPLEVADGSAPEVALVVALPDAVLSGVVLDPDGGPHADAWISVHPLAGVGYRGRDRQLPRSVSGPDGSFAFEGLQRGDYAVYVQSRKGDAEGHVDSVSADGGPVEIQLEGLASLDGRVTVNGRPVSHFQVDTTRVRNRAFVSEDGRFAADRIPAGEHVVRITAPEGAVSRVVELTAGARAQESFELLPWGTVSGRVVSADGAPVAGLSVSVTARGGERDARGRTVAALSGSGPVTDADGRFSVDGIGVGRGRMTFRDPGPRLGAKAIRGGAAFYAEAGETTDLGDIVMLESPDVPEDREGTLGLRIDVRHEPPPQPDAPRVHHIGAPAEDAALWVTRVEPGGAAESAGVEAGMRVLAIDGREVASLGAATAEALLAPDRVEAGKRYVLSVEGEDGPKTVRLTAQPTRRR